MTTYPCVLLMLWSQNAPSTPHLHHSCIDPRLAEVLNRTRKWVDQVILKASITLVVSRTQICFHDNKLLVEKGILQKGPLKFRALQGSMLHPLHFSHGFEIFYNPFCFAFCILTLQEVKKKHLFYLF